MFVCVPSFMQGKTWGEYLIAHFIWYQSTSWFKYFQSHCNNLNVSLDGSTTLAFCQTAFSLKSAAGICNHVNPKNLSGILSQWDIISMAYCHGRTTNGASCTSYKFVACYKIAQSFNHNFKNGSICIHHLQVVFILKPTALLWCNVAHAIHCIAGHGWPWSLIAQGSQQ